MMTFLAPTSFAAGLSPSGIAVGDYNADGKSDMAVVNNAAAGSVGIFISNGDGTFQPKVDYAAGAYAVDARAGDFNGDAKMDLAVVGTTGTVNILLGGGDGTFAPQARTPRAHTFNVTLKTAGLQSISVTDAANPSLAAVESGIDVAASSAAGLFVVTGFPAATAGESQSFTVAVKDPYGNFTAGYTGTVTFSSSDVQAGLPASYAFTAADAGVHTFAAVLKTAGAQSITVTDAASSAVLGSETGIAVSSAAAAKYVLSAPTSVTQGGGFKFTVTVLDAYGNVVTGYRGKVHLSSTDARAASRTTRSATRTTESPPSATRSTRWACKLSRSSIRPMARSSEHRP